MNQRRGSVAMLIVLGVILLILAGIFVYKFNRGSDSVSVSDPNAPELTEEEANALVESAWGGCTPDTCAFVRVELSKEGSRTYVIATYEGMRDDSVRASRKRAAATYKDGKWTLGEPYVTQRCWPDRGHDDFSAELCI